MVITRSRKYAHFKPSVIHVHFSHKWIKRRPFLQSTFEVPVQLNWAILHVCFGMSLHALPSPFLWAEQVTAIYNSLPLQRLLLPAHRHCRLCTLTCIWWSKESHDMKKKQNETHSKTMGYWRHNENKLHTSGSPKLCIIWKMLSSPENCRCQ